MRPLVFVVALSFIALLSGCGASPKAHGTPECPAPTLPDGAVLSSGSGGGFTGIATQIVAFADGRVEIREIGGPSDGTRTVDVGKPRIDRLLEELRATEVTDEDEGCYEPDEEDRMADGTSGGIVMRDGGVVRGWSCTDGGDCPDEVSAAIRVASAFIDEVGRQK